MFPPFDRIHTPAVFSKKAQQIQIIGDCVLCYGALEIVGLLLDTESKGEKCLEYH